LLIHNLLPNQMCPDTKTSAKDYHKLQITTELWINCQGIANFEVRRNGCIARFCTLDRDVPTRLAIAQALLRLLCRRDVGVHRASHRHNPKSKTINRSASSSLSRSLDCLPIYLVNCDPHDGKNQQVRMNPIRIQRTDMGQVIRKRQA
jgi:hypothetical protein